MTAEEFLREHLRRVFAVPDTQYVSIHSIHGDLERGYVNEIGFNLNDGSGGSTFMRADGEPLTLALMAASEDLLRLAFVEPWRCDGWESEIDERADAIWRLERVAEALMGDRSS
jgi:hypothetical protein